MKKQSIAALVCAAAFSLTASAESYTYTPGDTSLGNGTVTITYDGETTDIATLTANPSNGGTITLTGGSATFADGAMITLSSSGTVSFAEQVTAKGALTLARGDDVYREWRGAALTTTDPGTPAFPDICTSDQVSAADIVNTWECIHVVGGVPNTGSASGLLSAGRYTRIAGSIGSGTFVILNRNSGAFTYSIRVQLSPKADGMYARCRTGVRSPRRGLYPDLEERWPTANLWDGDSTTLWGPGLVARADRGLFGADSSDATQYGGTWLNSVSAMGLNTIILKRKDAIGGPMKVRFDGGALLGGTTTIPFGMEALVAVVGGGDASTFSNTITGTGDFTLVPSTVTATTPEFEDFISASKWQVLAYNRLLSSMTSIEGYILGGSQTAQTKCTTVGYHYNATNDTATCQFHMKRSNTSSKYVVAKFRQTGLNVEVAGVGHGYTEVGTGGSSAYPAFGTMEFPQQKITTENYEVKSWSASVSTRVDTNGEYVASNCTSGYGIRKITATFAGGGTATISGSLKTLYGGTFTMAGANGAKMLTYITSADGLPAAGEAHVGEGVLRLEASSAPGGGTTKIVVHSGGDIRNINSWQIGNNQELVFDGGTFYGLKEATYMHYVTLSNAVLKSTSPRVAYSSNYCYWRVIGTEPTTVLDGGSYWMNVYGYKDAATARSNKCAFRVEVEDVTGDSGADFIIPQIRGAAGRSSDRENYTWFWFEKYGPGTMKITGNSTDLRMESKLYNGTLLLAGSSIMTNEVQFCGGNLAVDAGKSNALGALTANKPGTITVGAGASLTFASFAPDPGLAKKSILIDAPLTGNALKFVEGISDYKGYFRWKDPIDANVRYRVKQDENGYLHPVFEGTNIAIR